MHAPLSATVGALIETNALRYPERVAFSDARISLTHAQFAARARRLAVALRARGILSQDRVAILSMNCIEYVEVFGAGELTGFITVALNWRLAGAELSYIIEDSTPRVLFFEQQYLPLVALLHPALDCLRLYVCIGADADLPDWAVPYEELLAGAAPAAPLPRAAETDIAYLLYTSGSTGRPKGCIVGQREAAYTALTLAAELGLMQTDRTLVMMPLFHIGAKAMQLITLQRGASMVLQRKFEPLAIPAAIAAGRITVLHLAPTMIQSVLDNPTLEQADLASLAMLVYSGSSMPVPLLRRGLALLGTIFVQLYGQTEAIATVLHRHQHQPDGGARDLEILASVGQPMIGVELRIVDEQGLPRPTGQAGEISYRSGGMFRGYWNNPVATSAGLQDGWCISGDIGVLDAEGFVTLLDRKKDMLISGGENIYSREVEEALLQHPAVEEAAVVGVPDAEWGEIVCAVVVLRAGRRATGDELVRHCLQLIASYKKPRRVVFTDSIQKLASGKVNKVLLRQLHGAATAPA